MITQINFIPGDTVRVHQKITEGDKSRVQVFEGTVIAFKGKGENRSFTVRKKIADVAVERIWPVKSVNIVKVEVKSHSKTKIRRAKLYYLRNNGN